MNKGGKVLGKKSSREERKERRGRKGNEGYGREKLK